MGVYLILVFRNVKDDFFLVFLYLRNIMYIWVFKIWGGFDWGGF